MKIIIEFTMQTGSVQEIEFNCDDLKTEYSDSTDLYALFKVEPGAKPPTNMLAGSSPAHRIISWKIKKG